MKRLRHIYSLFNQPSLIFIITAIISVAAEIMLLSYIIGDNSTFRLRAVLYIADSAILLIYYWLCSPGWRWLSLPMIWLISIFLLSNSLYFRYWGDMYPLSAIFIAANYNSFVFKSLPALFSISDLTFIIVPAAMTIMFLLVRPADSPSFSKRFKAKAIFLTLGLFASGIFLSVNSTLHWNNSADHPGVTRSFIFFDKFSRAASQYDAWKHNGLCCYLINLIKNDTFAKKISLSDTEAASIANYLNHLDNRFDKSSVISDNRGKNLIFIIVESLNAWTLNYSNGNHNLTPVLSSLIDAKGVISSTEVYPQIADGGSSDGQLIYNTGLLPLISGLAAQNHADNTFPSLVKALKPENSAEFIVEHSSVHNHRNTSIAYAYDSIHDRDSLANAGYDINIIGADEAVLNYAFDRISRMKQPFLAEITTLTMHYPFDIIGFEPSEWIDSLSNDVYTRRYCQTVHYTDAALGRFLNKLQASPLADNTVVVIVSDHDTPHYLSDGDFEKSSSLPIVFIALGSGITHHHHGPMGQIDVFPTVLDIMGVDHSLYPWRGLGKSILAGGPDAAIDYNRVVAGTAQKESVIQLQRAFNISDSIIRSDFFRTLHPTNLN